MDSPHGQGAFGACRIDIDHPRLMRGRQKRPHRHRPTTRLVDFVRTEQFEGVFMSAFNQLADRIQ